MQGPGNRVFLSSLEQGYRRTSQGGARCLQQLFTAVFFSRVGVQADITGRSQVNILFIAVFFPRAGVQANIKGGVR